MALKINTEPLLLHFCINLKFLSRFYFILTCVGFQVLLMVVALNIPTILAMDLHKVILTQHVVEGLEK